MKFSTVDLSILLLKGLYCIKNRLVNIHSKIVLNILRTFLAIPLICQYHSCYHVFSYLCALNLLQCNKFAPISLSIIEPHEKTCF